MAGVGILGIVVSKLRYKKKLCPIILLKVDKILEVDFYCAIPLSGLTVYLWVEGSEKSPLYAKEII